MHGRIRGIRAFTKHSLLCWPWPHHPIAQFQCYGRILSERLTCPVDWTRSFIQFFNFQHHLFNYSDSSSEMKYLIFRRFHHELAISCNYWKEERWDLLTELLRMQCAWPRMVINARDVSWWRLRARKLVSDSLTFHHISQVVAGLASSWMDARVAIVSISSAKPRTNIFTVVRHA